MLFKELGGIHGKGKQRSIGGAIGQQSCWSLDMLHATGLAAPVQYYMGF